MNRTTSTFARIRTHRVFVVSALVANLGAHSLICAQSGPDRRLADGSRVPVRLLQQVSSETATEGAPLNFEVVEDVRLGGRVIIKQGTPVRGVVVEAAAKRRMGRGGKLSYSLSETTTVEGQTIRLRAAHQKAGDSHVTGVAVTTVAVAAFVPVAAPFFLLRKGKDVTIPEGTRLDAFVDGDHVIEDPAPAPAAPAASNGGPTLTNLDILNLRVAGFGDDVIIARITSATANFSLDPTSLVTLRKAGISDRVLTAMLQQKRQ
jgi:hypothetical protein